jgi:hypothetical protein
VSDKRLCPVPGCGAAIRRGMLSCKECWYRVPAALRRQVNRTWRAFSSAQRRRAEERFALLRAYREAADAAIDASLKAR